jgi:hypothetical protein
MFSVSLTCSGIVFFLSRPFEIYFINRSFAMANFGSDVFVYTVPEKKQAHRSFTALKALRHKWKQSESTN